MKKIILLLLLSLFILPGCNSKKEEIKENSLNFSDHVDIMTVTKEYNTNPKIDCKYTTLVIKNLDSIKTIINSFNNLEVKLESNSTKFETSLYYLEFNGLDVYVINEKNIIVKNENIKKEETYSIIKGDVNFLNELKFELNPNYKPTDLKEMDFDSKITIKQTKKDAVIDVTGNKEIIDHIKDINYTRALNDDRVEIDYIIMIGRNKIEISMNNIMYVNEIKYNVNEGNFDFLSKIDFVDTGWLPWA